MLFVVLSIVVHAVLLLAVAASSGNARTSARPRPMKVVSTDVVPMTNVQPPKPPDTPPPEPVRQPEPDRIASRPVATPRPKPLTTPLPSPVLTPSPRPSLKPGATPSPSPTPTPLISPSPAPSPSNQIADLPPQEQAAKSAVLEQFKSQGVDLSQVDKLPPGFKSWQEYADFLGADYEKKAWELGMLPENTKGANAGTPQSPDPNATPDPNAPTPDPDATPGPDDGSNDGGNGWGIDIFGNPNKNPYGSDDPTPDSELDKLNNRKIEVDPNLGPPTGPIPQDYTLTDLGALKGVGFEYDGRTFKAQWPAEGRNKTVSVQHYLSRSPAGGRDQKDFDLEWRDEFDTSMNLLVKAIIQRYELQKQLGSR